MPAPDAAGGVVLYRPDPAHLLLLLCALKPQVARLLLFVNGPLDHKVRAAVAAGVPEARFIESGVNVGIAAALNGLAETASADGANLLVVFDQDSRVGPDHAVRLVEAHRRLGVAGERPAVIGPAPSSDPAEDRKAPVYRRRRSQGRLEGLEPVQFLATSGSLLDLNAWSKVGPFRADFFIDAVDTEWCFRAWSAGFSCWMEPRLPMLHRVGEGVITSRFLRLRMPRQKPFRMETYLRNSVYTWRLRHVPASWKLRQAAYLPVQALVFWAANGFSAARLLGLVRAVTDGAAGRLGRPRGLA